MSEALAGQALRSRVRAARVVALGAMLTAMLAAQSLTAGAQPSTSKVDPKSGRAEIEASLGFQFLPADAFHLGKYRGSVGTASVASRWTISPGVSIRVFGMCVCSAVTSHWIEYHRVSPPQVSPQIWKLDTLSRRERERLLAFGAALGVESSTGNRLRFSAWAGFGVVPGHRYSWRSDTASGTASAGGQIAIAGFRLRQGRFFVEQQGIIPIGRHDEDGPRKYLPLNVGVVF